MSGDRPETLGEQAATSLDAPSAARGRSVRRSGAGAVPPLEAAGTGAMAGKAIPAAALGVMSIPAVLFPPLAWVLGIAAIVVGVLALRDIARHPRYQGRSIAQVAIGCGALGLVLGVVLFVVALTSDSV